MRFATLLYSKNTGISFIVFVFFVFRCSSRQPRQATWFLEGTFLGPLYPIGILFICIVTLHSSISLRILLLTCFFNILSKLMLNSKDTRSTAVSHWHNYFMDPLKFCEWAHNHNSMEFYKECSAIWAWNSSNTRYTNRWGGATWLACNQSSLWVFT